jgi:biopolymer transport protein ExbD
VFFKIDDDANYGRAVRIMDICKGAGAKTLAIVTKDER